MPSGSVLFLVSSLLCPPLETLTSLIVLNIISYLRFPIPSFQLLKTKALFSPWCLSFSLTPYTNQEILLASPSNISSSQARLSSLPPDLLCPNHCPLLPSRLQEPCNQPPRLYPGASCTPLSENFGRNDPFETQPYHVTAQNTLISPCFPQGESLCKRPYRIRALYPELCSWGLTGLLARTYQTCFHSMAFPMADPCAGNAVPSAICMANFLPQA